MRHKKFVFTLLLLALVATAGMSTYVVLAKKKQRALPVASPSGSQRQLARTIRDVRVGDVIVHEQADYVVLGTVHYNEDGHRWTAARTTDGKQTTWLYIGIERNAQGMTRFLKEDSYETLGHPPDKILHNNHQLTMQKKGSATCTFDGEIVGLQGLGNTALPTSAARCRWWLYEAPGEITMILEQWGEDFRALYGNNLDFSSLDFLPGS